MSSENDKDNSDPTAEATARTKAKVPRASTKTVWNFPNIVIKGSELRLPCLSFLAPYGIAIDSATMRAKSLVSSLVPNRYSMIDSRVISRSPQIAHFSSLAPVLSLAPCLVSCAPSVQCCLSQSVPSLAPCLVSRFSHPVSHFSCHVLSLAPVLSLTLRLLSLAPHLFKATASDTHLGGEDFDNPSH